MPTRVLKTVATTRVRNYFVELIIRNQQLYQMMYCSHNLTRLRSRHPLRNFDLTISVADHTVSKDLAEFIPQWSKEPCGCKLPRKHWVQLNRLRRGSGRFADDTHRWGVSETSACDCGSEIQTYTHILQESPIWKSPRHLTKVDNPLCKTIHKTSFFDLSCLFFSMVFLCLCKCIYHRIITHYCQKNAKHCEALPTELHAVENFNKRPLSDSN